MHIELETKKLLDNLELLSKVSTKHATLPVLQCVLLEVKDGEVILKTTNLEIGMEAKIEATINEEGSIAVPAQTFLQIVQLHSEKNIILKKEEEVLTVSGKKGGSNTQLNSIAYDEFPSIPKIEGEGQQVNGKTLALGIKTAAFSASQSSIKPELGSVYVYQKKEHTATFVATDSFRLMEKTVPQKGVTLNQSMLLPQKNALEVARVCELYESSPVLKINENQCAFEFQDGFYITSRLTTGNFPDYEQIIPKEYESKVVLLKDDLLQAFKKSSVFLNKFFQVRLHITHNSLTISSDNGDVGTTTESINAETEGEELSLSFNQKYIQDALSHFGDDSLKLNFAGVGRPMVITGVNDSSMRYLVMPMNK